MTNKVIHYQFFYDHADCIALSATYPVPKSVAVRLGNEQRRLPGTIETKMAFPCISVYVPTSSSVLDSKRKQWEMKRQIKRIFAGLRRAAFFKAFRGIRLEVFDGRPLFGTRSGSRLLNGPCLRVVAQHYRQEREHRHLLQIAQASLLVHESRNFKCEIKKAWVNGDERDVQKLRVQHEQSLRRLCSTAGLVSAEVAKFNAWKNACRIKKAKPANRKTTLSDLDPSVDTPQLDRRRRYSIPLFNRQRTERCELKRTRRASACGDYKTDCATNLMDASSQDTHRMGLLAQNYIHRRVEKLVKNVRRRYHAPIEPLAFATPGVQPWNSLVLIMPHTRASANGLEVILFDREISFEDTTQGRVQFDPGLESTSVIASISDHRCVSNSKGPPMRAASLAYVLGSLLFQLGYCTEENWKLFG